MQKINDLSRIQEARLDADSCGSQAACWLTQHASSTYITCKSFIVYRQNILFLINACMFPFWLRGRALILYLCKSKEKKLTFKRQRVGWRRQYSIPAAYCIYPGSQINSVGKCLAPGADILDFLKFNYISYTNYIFKYHFTFFPFFFAFSHHFWFFQINKYCKVLKY